MEDGILSYNYESERYEIQLKGKSAHELHCGDTFEIEVHGKWIKTRVEYSWEKEVWYLIGIKEEDWAIGSKVRI